MQCNSQKAHCSWISYHCTGLQQSRIQCGVGSEHKLCHNACHFLQLTTWNQFFATKWRSFTWSCLHNSIIFATQPTAIPCKTFPLLLRLGLDQLSESHQQSLAKVSSFLTRVTSAKSVTDSVTHWRTSLLEHLLTLNISWFKYLACLARKYMQFIPFQLPVLWAFL